MKNLTQNLCISGIILFLLCSVSCPQQPPSWNPNAGVVLPYPAQVSTSSNNNQSSINDQDYRTFWQSDAPLPTQFMTRKDQNLLYHTPAQRIFANFNNNQSHDNLTDGDVNSASPLPSYTRITLAQQSHFLSLSLKLQTSQTVQIYALLSSTDSVSLGSYTPAQNFQVVRLRRALPEVWAFSFVSNEPYQAFEIAALGDYPAEYVILDLGKPQTMGVVMSKHFCENIARTEIWVSNDTINWQKAADLDARATVFMPIALPDTTPKRYLKAVHYLQDIDWNKASWWELAVYDQYGVYGKPQAAKPSKNTFAEQMGINGIWGWGNNKHSDELLPEQGTGWVKQVCQNARNYHPLDWDVTDPDHVPDYAAMQQGQGTAAQPWLNWDREYGSWQQNGINPSVTIKFDDGALQPMSVWDNPFQAGFNYGSAFGAHFGGNGLVKHLEVGNEPWQYPADFYQQILHGMSQGVKSKAPQILVFPCALQATCPMNETLGDFKNYTGARVTATDTAYIDGLNVHIYSYTYLPNGERIATYPEHPLSEMHGLFNDLRFRDVNMPQKQIYVTEWGWDSSGGGETCTHSECVSEQAQAAYLLRGILWLSRMGVDKYYWYFYANTQHQQSSVFSHSGLVASVDKNFAPKLSFHALKNFQQKVGNTRFIAALKEDATAYIYALGTSPQNITHLVAWRPIGIGNEQNPAPLTVSLKSPADQAVVDAYVLGETANTMPAMSKVQQQGNHLQLQVTAFPLVVAF
ncbi:MAG: hypothetical protein JNM36_00985 [Chitinophagales bacterium]|nr:hypothetical protein [Chitinophagales bacterium]